MSETVYEYEEVQKHATRDNFWTCIDGKVYDLTSFWTKHPGGEIILSCAGREGTAIYQIHHPFTSAKSDAVLQKYQIGVIAKKDFKKNCYSRSKFYAELIERMKKQGITTMDSLRDNVGMIAKGSFLMISLLILMFFSCYYGNGPLFVLYMLVNACCGIQVMHDGNHGGTSMNWYNKISGNFLAIMGSNSHLWTYGHLLHHHCPNQLDDPDLNQGEFVLRYNKIGPFYKYMRYQHIYAWFLYTLTSLNKRWAGLRFVFSPNYFEGYTLPTPSLKRYFAESISNIIVLFFVVIIPLYRFGFYWFIYWMIGDMISGIIEAIVFQVNHLTSTADLVPGTFVNPKEDWAIDQILGTTNFSHGKPDSFADKLTIHLAGGLGLQVEHHLFPLASHTSLPIVRRILVPLCQEKRVTYISHPSLWEALKRHYLLLKKRGEGKRN